MKISLSWLADFVDISDVPLDTLVADITEKVAEVEHVIQHPANQPMIVVGEIISVSPHPDADTLQICSVNVGTAFAASGEPVQIVCGGANVRDGLKVAVSLPGARVRWHGEGEPVELKKVKLRGEESYGMICSAAEIEVAAELLGSEPTEKGIVELHTEAAGGTQLSAAYPVLADVILDIDNHAITHRPDLFGQLGFAREIAAMYGKDLKIPQSEMPQAAGSIEIDIKEAELCQRYIGVRISAVSVQPSPAHIAARLASCGVRAINNIVDASNYVMLEIGQPTHAFDATKIDGEIIVRKAAANEKIVTLDDAERELSADMLVIADSKKTVAIAGVMGGANSEIDDSSTEIILESANFDAASVRRTGQALGLRSEASLRYEKRLDPSLTATAVARFVEVLRETCPDTKIEALTDAGNWQPEERSITLPIELMNKRIGVEIPADEAVSILESLGFAVEATADELRVSVPSWRAGRDCNIPEDIIEEVARMHGLNKIPSVFPAVAMNAPVRDAARELTATLQDAMVGYGFHEACTLGLISREALKKARQQIDTAASLINPPSEDYTYLRTGLLPSLLLAAERNAKHAESSRLFEIAAAFEQADDGVTEKKLFVAIVTGEADGLASLQGLLRSLFAGLQLAVELRPVDSPAANAHPGRTAEVVVAGQVVGRVAELHPAVATDFDLPQTAYFCLDFDALAAISQPAVIAASLPRYPGVPRDMAIIVPERTLAADLQQAISSADSRIADIELFDEYRGKGIEEGQKSLAFRFEIRDPEKTLEDSEADVVLAAVVSNIEKAGGQLRS